MSLNYFKGGIHPPEQKLTALSAIEVAPIPKKVTLHLSQHIGAPAEPLVKKGDEVKVGQLIASAAAFVSAPIHASISGKVADIDNYPHPMGKYLPAIVIESNDPSQNQLNYAETPNPFTLSAEELKARIKQAGIVGLGGATFPAHVKLSPPAEKPVDTLVINGAECEPYLTADHRLMVERTKDVIAGAGILRKILGAKQVIIGVEANKPDAVDLLKQASVKEISVVSLNVKYPQGSEKHLIKTLLDREVPPPPGLPMDVGVVVQNVGTVVAVWDAVRLQKPLIERVLTVSGRGIKEPKNLLARLGTPISELVEFCGGLDEKTGKVILGGPMMGVAQYSLDVPVIKGTSGVVALLEDEVDQESYKACIRCGNCVAVCPCLLLPNMLSIYGEHGEYKLAEEDHVMMCLECGCCSYGCPAKRPIVHWIRQTKAEIMAQRKKS
ncbi:MAG: electron transport complex subunit RsxC [Candidatus Schekmanbacteria bacterium]|nr:electron transport complex subunit RsxC [Candidatus Schekmanbacteria bacterium]